MMEAFLHRYIVVSRCLQNGMQTGLYRQLHIFIPIRPEYQELSIDVLANDSESGQRSACYALRESRY